MIIDFHIHLSLPEHEHPWVMDWVQGNFPGDMELSGLPGKKLMEYFPRLEQIAHKTVYGSDWPGNPDLQRNVTAIRALPISNEAKQAILYDNAAQIIGNKKLVPRSAWNTL